MYFRSGWQTPGLQGAARRVQTVAVHRRNVLKDKEYPRPLTRSGDCGLARSPRKSDGDGPDMVGAAMIGLARPDGSELNPKYVVPGLQRGLSVITLFGQDRRALSLTEIAGLLGLSRSATFRLTYTLESMGFLERRAEDDRYELGLKVLDLGYAVLASMDVVDVAEPALRALCDATGGSVHLARRDGTDVVYLMRFQGKAAVTANVQIGTRLPAHATSLGRALLMDASREDLVRIFGADAPLPSYSESSARDLDTLLAQLSEDRARGHVLGRSIYDRGLDTVSAPVRGAGGRIVASVSVVGFGLLSTAPGGRDGVIAALRDCVNEIGGLLRRVS